MDVLRLDWLWKTNATFRNRYLTLDVPPEGPVCLEAGDLRLPGGQGRAAQSHSCFLVSCSLAVGVLPLCARLNRARACDLSPPGFHPRHRQNWPEMNRMNELARFSPKIGVAFASLLLYFCRKDGGLLWGQFSACRVQWRVLPQFSCSRFRHSKAAVEMKTILCVLGLWAFLGGILLAEDRPPEVPLPEQPGTEFRAVLILEPTAESGALEVVAVRAEPPANQPAPATGEPPKAVEEDQAPPTKTTSTTTGTITIVTDGDETPKELQQTLELLRQELTQHTRQGEITADQAVQSVMKRLQTVLGGQARVGVIEVGDMTLQIQPAPGDKTSAPQVGVPQSPAPGQRPGLFRWQVQAPIVESKDRPPAPQPKGIGTPQGPSGAETPPSTMRLLISPPKSGTRGERGEQVVEVEVEGVTGRQRGGRLEQQVEHFREATRHLRLAGMSEEAERLERLVQVRSGPDGERSPPAGRREGAVEPRIVGDLQEQLQDLRAELRKLQAEVHGDRGERPDRRDSPMPPRDSPESRRDGRDFGVRRQAPPAPPRSR